LDTFAYSDDLVLADPREAVRVTQLVAEAFQHTPRTYSLAEAGPELSNDVVQYGPKREAEPDPFKIAFVDNTSHSHIITDPLPAKAQNALDRGRAAAKNGDLASAEAELGKAISLRPDVPGLHLELASVLARRAPELAETELRKTIHLDPTLSTTHRDLAKLLLDRGDVSGARIEVAHALAYWPTSASAFALARQIPKPTIEQESHKKRVRAFSIFLDVDKAGAIRVGAPPSAAARMYGGCRALLRFEPEMRAELFSMPRDMPYFLSAEEEMICVEAGIGATLVDRERAIDGGENGKLDEQSEELLRMAHTEGLLGYVMFEIIGQARPDLARMAPASVHRAIDQYVQRYVLDWDAGAEPNGSVALNTP
jgi:tetratricopeptide (TPR) repeat protein